jgi:hypothetical protein
MNRFVAIMGTHIVALQKSLQEHPSQVLNCFGISIILKEYDCIITDEPLRHVKLISFSEWCLFNVP